MKFFKINSRILKVSFIVILIVLLGFSLFTYFQIITVSFESNEVVQNHVTKALINQSFSVFKDIESSTRGYINTKDPLFLSIRKRSLTRLPLIMNSLKPKIEYSVVQLYHFNRLNSFYTERIKELDRAIVMNSTAEQQYLLEQSVIKMKFGMDQLNRMLREADHALVNVNKIYEKKIGDTPITFLLLISVFMIILLFSYISLNKQLKASQILQKNLEESNLSLEIANKSLALSQTFLKSVIETSPNGILTSEALRDEEGNIYDFKVSFANRNMGLLGDMNPENILGRKLSEIQPLLKRTDFYDHLINITENGNRENFQFHYPDAGLAGGWFDISISRLHDGVTLNARDISHIKTVEHELQKNNELLNERNREVEEQKAYMFTVFNALLDTIVTIDDHVRVVSANGMFYTLTKADHSIIGKGIEDIFRNQDKLIGMIRRALSGEFIYERDYLDPVINKFFDYYLIPLKNQHGKIYGVVLIGHDISEQVEAKAKSNSTLENLTSANDQLKQFSFIASHHLQEPLRKIMLFSSRLLDKYEENEVLEADMKKIRNASLKLSELINSFIKYSQLQVGTITLNWIDLNLVGNLVLMELNTLIKEKNAIIQMSELPTVMGDSSQMNQLFTQLITNSLKFCKRKPEITIECTIVENPFTRLESRKKEAFYRIRFVDNGIGFNVEYTEKVFAIFQRLNDNKLYPGLGMGLSICQRVIENHKGKISVYSIENEGSTFDVYLPAHLN